MGLGRVTEPGAPPLPAVIEAQRKVQEANANHDPEDVSLDKRGATGHQHPGRRQQPKQQVQLHGTIPDRVQVGEVLPAVPRPCIGGPPAEDRKGACSEQRDLRNELPSRVRRIRLGVGIGGLEGDDVRAAVHHAWFLHEPEASDTEYGGAVASWIGKVDGCSDCAALRSGGASWVLSSVCSEPCGAK